MTDHHADWQAIVDAPDQAAAVRAHLAGFLPRDDEDQALLDDLLRQFRGVRVEDGALVVDFEYREFEADEEEDVVDGVLFRPPYQGPTDSIPATVLDVLRVHNGFFWENTGFNGYLPDGTVHDPSFRYCDLSQSAGGAAFLAPILAAGLTARDITSPISAYSDWIIWHPIERNRHGEPTAYFVSHETCVPTRLDRADELAFGQILLRQMVDCFCDPGILDDEDHD